MRRTGIPPPDKFTKHIDILLNFSYLGRLRGIEKREWTSRGSIIDVGPARLKKAADKKNFEERVCIFREFEAGSCVDKFGGV